MNLFQNDMIDLVANVIEPYVLAATGVPVKVIQVFVGDAAQAPSLEPTVYVYVGLTRNYGFRYDTLGPGGPAGQIATTENQHKETSLHFYGYMPPDAPLTTLDIVNYANAAMQSNRLLAALRAVDAGVLRIGEVNNPIRTSEFERFEPNPTFIATLTHRMSVADLVPVLHNGPLEVYPV